MGGHFSSKTAVWTFWFWFFLCSVKTVLSADLDFIQDIGFDSLPDVTKFNVSVNEYTRMTTIYLERLQQFQDPETIPRLMTFNAERKIWRRHNGDIGRLRFPVKPFDDNNDVEVQSAELRMLAPAVPRKRSMLVSVYQVLSPRRRRFLEQKVVYLSESGPKWCEVDVTSAVQSWMVGERNLGLSIECEDCDMEQFRPVQAALSVLVLPGPKRRKRNANFPEARQTDCSQVNTNTHKQRCCRHEMMVTFKKLNIPSIIQPKTYEAGFCKGRCPLNFNHATNHSHIQNLVHKLDRKATPRACCAPSKLEPLEILRVDPHDGTKLSVEKWDNMIVVECACS